MAEPRWGIRAHFDPTLVRKAIQEHEQLESLSKAEAEVKEVLQEVQTCLAQNLEEQRTEHKGVHPAYEDNQFIIFRTLDQEIWDDLLRDVEVEEVENIESIVKTAHRLCSEKEGEVGDISDPVMIVEKPADWRLGEAHAERTIARLITESGSAAQGIDRWALEHRGKSAFQWGDDTDRHRNVVGRNAKRGREN